VHGKSPRTNAVAHIGKKYIVTLDIQDFFNTITEENVQRTLAWLFKQQTGFSYTADDTGLLAKIMCFNAVLPQGAPTSPVISNLICLGLDKKLADLAKAHNATITRYADDIALSGDDPAVVKLKTAIYSHIYSFGFRPNKKKTKIRKYYQRQTITGVVVNTKTSVKKEVWRKLRAQLHNQKISGLPLSPGDYQKMRGQVEWIKSLNPQRGNQLLAQLSLINVV
jgi:retron-type reverse transcriptase